ncbi:MAG: permease [Candidatus Altiarchaeota archaeon]|nr:permease [Candidatus Altiarchaeota archaeon]
MRDRYKIALIIVAFFAFYFIPHYLPQAAQASKDPLMNGLFMLYDYAKAHTLTCLLPAFFIAGAISALMPKESISRHLGQKAPRHIAYPLAILGGLLLAVCSCTILPLFAGIKKKGAGLGPAIAFLYTSPATNILAIVFTGGVLGWQLAGSRIFLSVIFATLIGIIITAIFKEDDVKPTESQEKIRWNLKNILTDRIFQFTATLILILITGTRLTGMERIVAFLGLTFLLILQAIYRLSREEAKAWLSESYLFTAKIFPLLLIGVFVAGAISALMPEDLLENYVGGNTITANLFAVLFGVVMYFPTLVEVPMAQMFLSHGMGNGPLLAYLLADPVISLPSILVVRGLIGTKKTAVYILLITFFCTLAGLIYGTLT